MTPERDAPEWILLYVALMFGAWLAFMSLLFLI